MVVPSQFGIYAKRLGKNQPVKSEIRNPWGVLGKKSKNKKHVTVLVDSANFLYQT